MVTARTVYPFKKGSLLRDDIPRRVLSASGIGPIAAYCVAVIEGGDPMPTHSRPVLVGLAGA